MTGYFRLGGAALIMIGAMMISRAYESYLKRRISEYRGLVSLISHAEGEISRFLSYGGRLWQDFSDRALDSCGLLQPLKNGESLQRAFDLAKDKMSLSKEAIARLAKEFSRLGKGYRESELSLLSSLRESLAAELDTESVEAEKNIKVARALLLGGALAVGILVI